MIQWPLAALRSEFRTLAQVKSQNQLSDAEVQQRINQYYTIKLPLEAMPRELFQHWHFKTVVGQESYDVPPGINAVLYLDQALYPEQFSYYMTGRNTQHMSLQNGALYIRPKPTVSYEVYLPAYFKPAALDNDKSGPLVDDWGPLIAAGAALDYLIAIGNMPRADEVSGAKSLALALIGSRSALAESDERATPRW